MVRQYSSFEPMEGRHVSFDRTLGEDIADSGGLYAAVFADHNTGATDGEEDEETKLPGLEGLGSDQQIFLAYATVSRNRFYHRLCDAMKTKCHCLCVNVNKRVSFTVNMQEYNARRTG